MLKINALLSPFRPRPSLPLGPFRYRHFGNFTYNVDERAEVGLLSRNIVIEGVMQKECTITSSKERKVCQRFGRDTFGGHIKVCP